MARLADVILRSAMKRGATKIVVAGTTVHFEVTGELELDTDVPPPVRDFLIEQLAGMSTDGRIVLGHRDDHATFAIEIKDARAELRRI